MNFRQARRANQSDCVLSDCDDNIRAALFDRIGADIAVDFQCRSFIESDYSIVTVAQSVPYQSPRRGRIQADEVVAFTRINRDVTVAVVNGIVAAGTCD